METPLISIVIAVYNVEDYVKRCLCSIEKQKKNFEVIIIDDGSTDKSGTICDLWASDKDYAFVYHQKNQGISTTRNNGVKYSNSEYIVFVDPDDWVADKYTEIIEKLIVNNGGVHKVDAVGLNYVQMKQSKGELITKRFGSKYPKEYTNGKEVVSWIVQTKVDSYTWQYVIKKQLYNNNNIIFPDMILYEDAATLYKLLYFSNVVVLTNIPLYSYFQRKNSFVNTATLERTTEYFSLFNNMKDFFILHNRSDLLELGKEYRLTRLFTAYANMVRLDINNNSKKVYYTELSQYIKNNYVKQPLHASIWVKQLLFYTHLFRLATYIHDWMGQNGK